MTTPVLDVRDLVVTYRQVRSGHATAEERTRFQELHEAQSRAVLALDPDALFAVQELTAWPLERPASTRPSPAPSAGRR